MATRSRVSSGSPWEAVVGYSRAIRVGNHIEVAGTTAMDGDRVVGEGDPYAQTQRALEIIAQALTELGADRSQVVRTRLFVTDISAWQQIGGRTENFSARPVRSRPWCR
ncbi:MAG: Rid family hydrolase [Sulfobacillus sp.]